MPYFKELAQERDQLRQYINRVNGASQDPIVTVASAELENELPFISENPRLYFHDEDGRYWKPQDTEGNFSFLPGYDGPVS